MTFAPLLVALFVQPMTITGPGRLLMLLPLAAAMSVVYKTIHCERVRDVPKASLVFCLMIVAFMMSIGIVLLLLFRLMA